MQTSDSILITGSTGFVGKNLVKKMKELGYTNLLTPRMDLTKQGLVEGYFRDNKPNYVIHLAAVVGGIAKNIADPYKFLNENLQMQSNVINSSIDNKVKKFLFLSSSCCYPKDYPLQPLKEEYMMQANVEPTNEGYALAKIAGMKMCEYANKQTDTKFIVLAPTNLYGPGDHFDLKTSHALSALIMKTWAAFKVGGDISVWGSGNQRREWLYIDDLIDCLLWSMENIESTKTFLNVGTGIDISMNYLANRISTVLVANGMISWKRIPSVVNDTSKPDGMLKKCLDVSNINALGWKSKINLDEGLKETIKYYYNYEYKTSLGHPIHDRFKI